MNRLLRHTFRMLAKVTISFVFFVLGSTANADEIKPYWDIQDLDLEMHIKSLVYLRDVITLNETASNDDKPNYIFLSGDKYIHGNALNIQLIGEKLHLVNSDFLKKYSETKERCLILTLENFGGKEVLLTINGTENSAQPSDFKCLLASLFKFEGVVIPIGDTASVKDTTIRLVNTYLQNNSSQ